MSEDMAVGDNATTEEAKLNGDEAMARATDAEGTSSEPPSDPAPQQAEELALLEVIPKTEPQEVKEEPEKPPEFTEADFSTRGIKRRASSAFSDNGEELRGFDAEPAPEEEFRGFNDIKEENVSIDYGKVLQLLEAEVTSATKSYTPIKTIKAIPTPLRASKRNRQDTDGSRPSSALSSRSDGEGLLSNNEGTTSTASSPANRGRRSTIDVSSPLLRVPLELGWKRELVYRATLDSQQRRNADIYYYTPFGKKLRSTREVAETLSGTGLTLENFSFFKEPLGIDDPEKEIIRDARLFRKMESPAAPPAPVVVEGKRTPKPKQPKGASPEPATTKSPQAKIKVKSVGSRLSGSGPPATKQPPAKQPPKKAAPADNNNSAAWKKPRQPAPTPADAPVAPPPLVTPPMAPQAPEPPVTPPPPPPLQLRPQPQSQSSPDIKSPRQVVQPCSMTCGRGVPTLSCAACLCLYHPACAGHPGPAPNFMCKNCRKSTSPPLEPPPLLHKWGVPAAAAPARPRPLHLPVTHTNTNKDKRVLLRMKVAGGGPDGERVWAVAKPQQTMAKQPPPLPKPLPVPKPQTVARPSQAASPRILALRPMLPQSLAVINGRRFIVVPRNIVTSSAQQSHEEKRTRSRLANGAASPDVLSPRSRRGRPKVDDTDHFTAFYNKAQEHNYNVVVQIFQYLGMRELAVCARVCRLWRTLSSTPALWRHVRMKNSHVSDWGGLCAALKRHGTVRLDLRKMLLPQNDAVFWQQFALHIPTVDTLERIEMCRCPATAVEAVSTGLPNLRSLSALAIRDALLDPAPLGGLRLLRELRLKSMNGLSMTQDLRPLAALTNLQHLSLTSIKDLGWCASDIIGQLDQLESLELGECTFRAEFAGVLGKLKRLRRLRLERGTAQCAAPQILRTLATLPLLTRLELVNIDVKVGFDDALAECKNIQRLLIIPTYVSQSATTNKQVLSGVLRLKDTLTHLMWGVTIELLRVTELFIDQCEQAGERAPRDLGECIPVLKPVPGCRLPDSRHPHQPPQVEILPLPTLQRLLSAQLPHTKLKLLRIPFHATWRQTLADFQ